MLVVYKTLDNKKGIIKSQDEAIMMNKENNKIFIIKILNINQKIIFLSLSDSLKLKDKMENVYEFSQIYIDTKKGKYLVLILKLL